MITCNSLDVKKLVHGQELYLIRYSHVDYPDFIVVKFKSFENNEFIKYINDKSVVKKISIKKITYRLFHDVDEMSRMLYDCFIKRKIELLDEYKPLFTKSQDVRPELWI